MHDYPIVNIEWLNLVVENLAKQTGAGQAKIILTRSGQSRLTEERESGCSIRNLCKIFTTLLSRNWGGDNPAKTQSRWGVDQLVVKKDRSDESYQRPIKKYATPILSDPSPTLNSYSVFSINHLARSTAIVQASEFGAISLLGFPIPLLPKVGVGNYRGS